MGSLPKGISGSRAAAILGLGEYEGQTPFTVWQLIMEERFPARPMPEGSANPGIVHPAAKRGELGYLGFNAERAYILPPPVDNAAVRWGSAFEDAIVELASAAQGKPIRYRERLYATDGDARTFDVINPDHFITCHVDGVYDDLATLHEGKTTSLFNYWDNWGTPGTDRIPQGYQIQVQHQMLCTGAGEAIVSVLVFPRRADEWEAEGLIIREETAGVDADHYFIANTKRQHAYEIRHWAQTIAEMNLFHQYVVPASPALQSTLVDAYRHFWHTYVLPEREPEIDAYADLRRAFPAPKGTLVATEAEARWAAEYHEIGEEISPRGRLGKRREELKVLLLKSMRARDGTMDDESREKTVLRDGQGKKLASWDGRVFR